MLFAFLFLTAAPAWERIRDDAEFTIDRRALTGAEAGMYEVRASTHTAFSPKQLFDTVWRSEDYPQFQPDIIKVVILEDKPNARLIYQQQKVPVVENRDYTVRVRADHDASTGLYQIFVNAAPDAGPPPQDKFVRIRRTHAMWTFEPAATGGCELSYVVASEAGGNVPQWIANHAQKETIVNYIGAILKRVAFNAKHPAASEKQH